MISLEFIYSSEYYSICFGLWMNSVLKCFVLTQSFTLSLMISVLSSMVQSNRSHTLTIGIQNNCRANVNKNKVITSQPNIHCNQRNSVGTFELLRSWSWGSHWMVACEALWWIERGLQCSAWSYTSTSVHASYEWLVADQ